VNLEYVWREVDFWKLLTLLVAAFATYVAYRQYALGRERFKLDLFEKRFAVFAATRRLLSHVLHDADVSLEQLFEYRAGVAEATFLFDSDITDYLKSIDEKALRLRTIMETMKALPVGEARTKAAGEVSEATQWLTEQLPELKNRFSPYLKFRTWT
jgi:hypothetical protein